MSFGFVCNCFRETHERVTGETNLVVHATYVCVSCKHRYVFARAMTLPEEEFCCHNCGTSQPFTEGELRVRSGSRRKAAGR